MAIRPDGATSRDGSAGTSVVTTGRVPRIVPIHTLTASAMITTIRIAKNAARMPSMVVLVTICSMSSTL